MKHSHWEDRLEMPTGNELRSAIEGLNALGHEEIAQDMAQRAEMIQDRMHRSLARHRPERREEREYAPVHPEISHAIRQLLRDVKEIKKNPPFHPEINHVIKELRQQVQELREQVGELRRASSCLSPPSVW